MASSMGVRTRLACALSLWALTSLAQSADIRIYRDGGGIHDSAYLLVLPPGEDTLSFGGGSGTAGYFPRPYVSATASAFGSAPEPARVRVISQAYYYFSLLGPASTELVPIGFVGKASASLAGEPSSYSYSNVRIMGSAGSSYSFTCQADFSCAVGPDGTFTGSILLRRFEMGTVMLIAETTAISYGRATTGSAFIDPYFFIDPGFLAEHPGYSLSFSGVGNEPFHTAPVPEPETYAMLMAGLGILGAFTRRGKQNPA